MKWFEVFQKINEVTSIVAQVPTNKPEEVNPGTAHAIITLVASAVVDGKIDEVELVTINSLLNPYGFVLSHKKE